MTLPHALGDAARGVVAAFDARVGLGSIALDDGREVAFHSTQLVDGTRHVDAGARVSVRVVRWHRAELEATAVTIA